MSELKEIRIPDLENSDSVPVAELFIKEGDRVAVEQPLLVLESDKAVLEIPSPVAGLIKELKIKEGDLVKSGDIIALAEAEESAVVNAEKEMPTKKKGVSEPPPPASEAEPEHAAPQKPSAEPASSLPQHKKLSHASPSVRHLARELGVDLKLVKGTAPKGRITRQDVHDFVKTSLRNGPAAGAQGLPELPWSDPAEFGAVREQELTRIQKISGPRLHASWTGIPHVTHFDKADISYLERWRQELNEEKKEGVKYTILAFVIKALYKAVEEYSRFNAVLSPDGSRLLIRRYYNIGIAVDTPEGLLVPVIKEVDRKSLSLIVREIEDLALRAKKGELKSSDLKGAGISISNLGGIGGQAFTPIINPPEVAILGLSRAAMEAMWTGSEFEARLMLPLSLSYDHRVIDGAQAARFLKLLKELLEDVKKNPDIMSGTFFTEGLIERILRIRMIGEV